MAEEKDEKIKELEKSLARELDQEVVATASSGPQETASTQNISGGTNVDGGGQAGVKVGGGESAEGSAPVQFKAGGGPAPDAGAQLKEVDAILTSGDGENIAKIENIREEIKDNEVRVDPADSIQVQIDDSAPMPDQIKPGEGGVVPPGPKPPLIQAVKQWMMGPFKSYLVKWVYWVRSRNKKQWAIMGLILLLIAGMVALVKVRKLLFIADEVEIEGDFSRVADREIETTPEERPFREVEPLTDFIIEIEKIVVNIQRSENSGSNPMATVVVLVECENQETAVELKDKEVAIKDVIQRVMEKMSYDQLFSAEGKMIFKDRARHEINRELTAGKARSVFINLIILKP